MFLRVAANSLNFANPVLSLFRMTLQIIKNPLLTAIKAHVANVRRMLLKTTAKPLPIPALHF